MRGRRGQILIISVLSIVIVMLTVSSLLISTSLFVLNLPESEFRETVTQIYFGSRAATAYGLADVTKRLNQKAASTLYQNYTTLEELNGSENSGLEIMSRWQNDTLRNYPTSGLSINFTGPMFDCDWNDPVNKRGYSKAETNVSIALLNQGFEGFEDAIIIEFNATIEDLIETDGKDTSFKINFVREMGDPVEDMVRSLISVFFETRIGESSSFSETEVKKIRYCGNGSYIVYFTADMNNITYNLDLLRQGISEIPPENFSSARSVVSDSIAEGWHFVAGGRDGTYLRLYVDGEEAGTPVDVTGYGSLDQTDPLRAAVEYGEDLQNYFNGKMDEIRIIKQPRSEGWLNATFNNVVNGDFASVGDETSQVWNGSWTYQRDVTVNHQYIGTDLEDFPLLVVLNSSAPQSFNYSRTQPNGEDIRFTDASDQPLDYEIEKWNDGGESFIWVKVPYISGSSDTTLYIHYGNPQAEDGQNPQGVWDGYSLVQHLNEETGDHIDSSSFGNDGAYTGSSQGAAGVVDGADGFNGVDEHIEWPDDGSLNPGNGSFTASFWAELHPDVGKDTLLMKGDSSPTGIRYEFYLSGDQLVLEIDDNMTKENLLNLVDEIEALYEAGNRSEAYYQLDYLRQTLADESTVDTTDLQHLAEIIRSQLDPRVRVVARDFRGITVSLYGALVTMDDTGGPDIVYAQAQPDAFYIGEGVENVNLTAIADDRWYGNSNVSMVEYYISDSPTSLPMGATPHNMTPVDGAFDSPREEATANVSTAELSAGDNYIWIRALDSADNWGGYEILPVTVSESDTIRIGGIEMQGYYGYWWFWRYNWVEATVTILDGTGSPVEGATVHGYWSGHVSGEDERITLSDGTCVFESPVIWGNGRKTYTFTVDNVYKDGYTWDGETATETLKYP
ncbi:MAG: DUF2341 domain-containing protein [Candidatus Bathyarchaeia archaeon]